MTAIIVIVVVVILAAWLVSMYNSLVKMRNNRENAFADIDVQLKPVSYTHLTLPTKA